MLLAVLGTLIACTSATTPDANEAMPECGDVPPGLSETTESPGSWTLGASTQWVGVTLGGSGGTAYSCFCQKGSGECLNWGCELSINYDPQGELTGSCSGKCSGPDPLCSAASRCTVTSYPF